MTIEDDGVKVLEPSWRKVFGSKSNHIPPSDIVKIYIIDSSSRSNVVNQLVEEPSFIIDIKSPLDSIKLNIENILSKDSLNSLEVYYFAYKDHSIFQEDVVRYLEKYYWLVYLLLKSEKAKQFFVLHDGCNPLADSYISFLLSVITEKDGLEFTSIEVAGSESIEALQQIRGREWISPTILKFSEGDLYQRGATLVSNKSSTTVVKPEKGKTYLITGKGGIAKALSRYLKNNFSAKIILLGKSSLTLEEKSALKNACVDIYISADISDYHSLQLAWQKCEDLYGEINGVFHLAGVIDDGLFLRKSYDRFRRVCIPKVDGTINLDLVTQNKNLDFFVCFSSLTAYIGNLGQADYAAANAFMDAYCKYRQNLVQGAQRSGHTFTINWGLWKSGGMKMPALNSQDILPLDTDVALDRLFYVISQGVTHSIIYEGSLSLSRHQIPPSEKESKTEVNSAHESGSCTTDIQSLIEEIVYKHTKIKDIDPTESLIERGIDSVAAINITSDIELILKSRDKSIKLTKTILFDKPSISRLTAYLKDKYPQTMRAVIPQNKTNIIEVFETLEDPRENQNKSVKKVDRFKDSDIAIVGMSGKFPMADDTTQLWSNLEAGKNCIQLIPQDRWDWRECYSPDTNGDGVYGRHGGFVSNIKEFDPEFFQIMPSEASRLDPQERMLLMNVHYALEDAAILPSNIVKTGVFTAAMFGHYALHTSDQEILDMSFASLSNRVSYFYNFKGPSISVDTMCSGSMTALHLGVRSILSGDCDQAVVSGVNLMPSPVKYRLLSKGKFLSPTGKCHTFGINADGYVPGEGVISIVIKKLNAAITDGDKIYGVIKAISVNSNGRSSSFTVPSQEAQKTVIRNAIDMAEIDSNRISYIEAHGTGTKLGDPIEINALSEALEVQETRYCPIGSIKTNIGHLESAAALAGVVKVLLQFQHKTIVASLNSKLINPYLHIEDTPFFVPQRVQNWEKRGPTMIAGVSSFGAGGSNGHAILEEYVI